MTTALAILSLIIIALSLYGALLPYRLLWLAQGFMQQGVGLWIAVGIRLLLAVMLWISGPDSHTPASFKVLAVLLGLTAVTLPMVGRSRLNQFLEHIAAWPSWSIRLQCLLGILLGGFILWSIS